ncbi:MAG: SDR family oxidoreductase [Gammaproteobacteria bacterium]|jgi:NAD(P)-dependent dehydrogenase (short-subunit alcohol dehydrogenase family)
MDHDFSDRHILITGAGRGLGRHLAVRLAGFGATVGVADIDAENCRQTVAAIEEGNGRAFAFPGDVSDRDTFQTIAAEFSGVGGRIDAIVNNAMMLKYCPVEEVEPEQLSAMLDVGIKALFWSAQTLLEHYDAERGACLINMASPVAVRGYPGTSAYSTVKGAVVSFTRVMAAELGPRKIRVNAVSPASVPTPGAMGLNTREEYERRAASIPLRRNGTEDDNSNAIAFLLSDDASFVNGEVFNVDGGVAACA